MQDLLQWIILPFVKYEKFHENTLEILLLSDIGNLISAWDADVHVQTAFTNSQDKQTPLCIFFANRNISAELTYIDLYVHI